MSSSQKKCRPQAAKKAESGSMVEEGAGAEISHGFVPTKLAADIKESRCTRPIACVQNYWTDILDEVTKGTGDVASIIDRLKEFGFFESAEGSEHEATQSYLKASHKQDTRDRSYAYLAGTSGGEDPKADRSGS